jgi:hypothetical protein
MAFKRWLVWRIGLALFCSLPLVSAAGDERGRRDRSFDREEFRDQGARAKERRSEANLQDSNRDRRRQLSPEERQRLRRDVLEAYRFGREGR